MWWIMIIGLMFTVHFKTMYFKKRLNDIPNLFLIMLVTIAGIAALDYYGILTLSAVSALIFNYSFPLQWKTQGAVHKLHYSMGVGGWSAKYNYFKLY